MTDFLSETGINTNSSISPGFKDKLLNDKRESTCAMELKRILMSEFKKENMPGNHYLVLIKVASYCGLEQLAIWMKEYLEKNLNKLITKPLNNGVAE